jgi:phosphoribosylaminoimidazolecarboxamide formyltransferase/IMP cyclohydrolase
MYALISVSDKKGIIPFAQTLVRLGFKLVSTGGTYELLQRSGLTAERISDLTAFPEILGGRVKTLHPAVFGGILANRTDEAHVKDFQKFNLPNIQLVVVNL